MSDRVGDDAPTVEQRMDDVRAVMDAVGLTRAALIAISEGASLSTLFAATYPDRVWALVLIGGIPCGRLGAGYEHGATEEAMTQLLDVIEEGWGTGVTLPGLPRR